MSAIPADTVSLTQEEAPHASEAIWSPDTQETPPTVHHLHDVSGMNLEEDDQESLYGSEADADEQREQEILYREEHEEPCTFGRERGICRCCGELTLEPDEY